MWLFLLYLSLRQVKASPAPAPAPAIVPEPTKANYPTKAARPVPPVNIKNIKHNDNEETADDFPVVECSYDDALLEDGDDNVCLPFLCSSAFAKSALGRRKSSS